MSGETPVRTLRVPEDVWRAALDRAAEDGTTLSAEALAFIRAYARGERYVLKARTSNSAP